MMSSLGGVVFRVARAFIRLIVVLDSMVRDVRFKDDLLVFSRSGVIESGVIRFGVIEE